MNKKNKEVEIIPVFPADNTEKNPLTESLLNLNYDPVSHLVEIAKDSEDEKLRYLARAKIFDVWSKVIQETNESNNRPPIQFNFETDRFEKIETQTKISSKSLSPIGKKLRVISEKV